MYAIPNSSIFHTEEILKLEEDVKESRISKTDFKKNLQVRIFSVSIHIIFLL